MWAWLPVMLSAVAVVVGRDSAAASKQQEEEKQGTEQGDDGPGEVDRARDAGADPGRVAAIVVVLHVASLDQWWSHVQPG